MFVCMPEVSLRLHRRNHVLSAASLQPHREREREEKGKRELFDGLPVEAPCVRERQRERPSARRERERGKLPRRSLVAAAGQPESKSLIIIVCAARVRIAARYILVSLAPGSEYERSRANLSARFYRRRIRRPVCLGLRVFCRDC